MDEPILACNLHAIPAEERPLHQQRWAQLLAALHGHEAQAHGYTLTFALDHATLPLLAQVVNNERLCCPFLHFAIAIAPEASTCTLTLSGPPGTRELLAAELGLST